MKRNGIPLAWLAAFATLVLSTSPQSFGVDGTPTFEELKETGAQKSRYLSGEAAVDPPTNGQVDIDRFRDEIKPILKRSCAECHGAATQEGNVRIDTLDPDLVGGKDVDWWLEVFAVVSNGEMPPPDEGEMRDADRSRVIDWLSTSIQVASAARRSQSDHSSFRRMTRYEYNYALQDLLGLPWDFARDLPPEAHSEDGFQNSSELLHMSVMQFETYRELARDALLRAIPHGPRPPVRHWGVSMSELKRIDWEKQEAELEKLRKQFKDDTEKLTTELAKRQESFRKPPRGAHFKQLSTGRTVGASWNYHNAKFAQAPADSPAELATASDFVAVLPRNGRLTIELGDQLPDEGNMRVRIRASRTAPGDAPKDFPSLQLLFGWQASNEGRALLPTGDDALIVATADAPDVHEFSIPLGELYPRNSVRGVSPMGITPSPSEYIRLVNHSVSQGSIQIHSVEVAAPVYETWPPASYDRLFGGASELEERQRARAILEDFMDRAWRRAVTDEEVDRKLRLFDAVRPQCEDFEEGMVEVLAAVLASPNFLYLSRDISAELAPHELATRLSIFLWCSIPDAELLELADNGTLADPEVFDHQVDRMLADLRSKRFSEHFVHQWLDLQLLDFLAVEQFEPRISQDLKDSMAREPIALFHDFLQGDESVLGFIHGDYTVADERLSRHYGIGNVYGNHFRRVALDPRQHRGGLLTQAGLLAMNSDGKDSNPLKRGIWLLESLLNDPPPPPPPAVPEIDLADPEVAKMTLKERIEDHRNHAACRSCHIKIDPWGIAFENYDALGRWRTQVKGKTIDASSKLFNDEVLDGIGGLKRHLLEHRQDQFIRAMVHKITTYALGRPLTFSDRSEVDAITAQARRGGDGLATIVRLVATSDLFRSP
ncbi:MAG: DUF1592 domain-containing protein [Planctomycetota bacterium]